MLNQALMFLIGLLLAVSASGPAPADEPVRVGVYDNKPMVFFTDGKVEGFYIDILEYIAGKEGWKLEYVRGGWQENLDRLKRGEIDLLVAIAYSDERAEIYDFTQETMFVNWGRVYTHSALKIDSILGLEGRTIAAVQGDIYTQGIQRLLSQFDIHADFIEGESYADVFDIVARGEADAGVVSRVFGAQNQSEEVQATPIIFNPIELRFALPQDGGRNAALIHALDTHLAALKQDQSSIYYQSVAHWFGGISSRKVLPGWVKWTFIVSGGLLLIFGGGSLLLRSQVRARTRELRTEIAERARVEEQLRQSEQRYRAIFEGVQDAIFVETPSGAILDVNQRACEMFGYSHDEFLAKTVADLVPPDNFALVPDKALEQALPTVPIETVNLRADGTTFPVEITGRLQKVDGETVMLVVVRDVTERKQAEKERMRLLKRIQEQAEQMQKIVDNVPAGVVLLDAEGHILLANPMARESLSVLVGDDTGETLTHLGPLALSGLLAHHPEQRTAEVTLQAASSAALKTTARIFQVQASPVGEGAARQWLLMLREVTAEREQQRKIQAQERLATVGQLAAGIAHDFNNIMASIVLYAAMLLRDPDLSPKVRERLSIIHQQGHRAANLVQQILDFARKSIMDRQPLDLLAFIRELEQLLERTLPENIHLHVEHGPGDYFVHADPTRIQQAVMNLALNARDAMPDGGDLRFRLSRFRLEVGEPAPLVDLTPGNWVKIEVSDTGTGIPPEILPRIFEPFFTTKEIGQGTGLGLAQVHGIVAQHGGFIDVDSQPGYGTTFTLYLPTLPIVDEAPDTPAEAEIAQGRGETILVVEDDALARAAIAEILSDIGYQVRTAANGQEALTVFDRQIALVISDLVMPQLGGNDLYQALKARHPQVKMIVTTGYPMDDEGRELLESGITAWVKKPFSAEEISAVVQKVLG